MDPSILPMGLVERRTRHFGISVLCDPYVYVHRNSYWCGIFYEEEVECYIRHEIKAGDSVIDVGMNVGHVALPAAVLVGPQGKVLAFEPNTELASRVRKLAERQRLQQLKILPYGLGSVDGFFELKMEPTHAGGATFRDSFVTEDFSKIIQSEVRIGDTVLATENFTGKVFLKMDVEGFEVQALTGMVKTLSRIDHAIIEISPDWLHIAGIKALFEIMERGGLYAYRLCKDGTVGDRIFPELITSQINVIFRR